MSAQGATLRRGTIELPIWPVAVLVVVALAAAIGMTALGDAGQTRFVTSVSDSERFANSTAAVREQGAVAPSIDLTNSGVAIRNRGFAVQPNMEPTTAIREQGATLPVIVGISHVAPSLHGSASATIGTGWDSMGGQNEALHRQYGPPQEDAAPLAGAHPIMVNGEPCMQCR
jgi:hypothetical protein